MEGLLPLIEKMAQALEVAGVGVIGIAFSLGALRFLLRQIQTREEVYDGLKKYLGRALLLGLEFLVAADIIRTVTVELTVDRLYALGLLVILRILLGWSIALEVEGCWPWNLSKQKD